LWKLEDAAETTAAETVDDVQHIAGLLALKSTEGGGVDGLDIFDAVGSGVATQLVLCRLLVL